MSLINDALKKAQSQREADAAGENPGAPAGHPGARLKRGRSPASFYYAVLLVAGAAVLVGASILATAYFLRADREPSPVAVAGAKESAPTAARLLPAPSPVSADESPSLVLPSSVKGSAAVPSSTVSSAKDTKAQAETAADPGEPKAMTPIGEGTANEAPLLVLPPGVGTPVGSETAVARPDPRIQAFVDDARVVGVRASGADSKVLMNERVYRLNEVVDATLGLKLVEISTTRLVFEAPDGIRYTRSF